MITSPGIYAMSSDRYHANPALSSTGARILVSECPAEFIGQVREEKREFDIGNAAHLLILQPDEFEQRIWRISFDDYRKDAAQEERDAARAGNRIPLLPKEVAQVEAMRTAVFSHPIARLAFRDGQAEQSLFWIDPEFGIPCRTRPDWLPNHRRYLVDIKTAMSAKPDDFARAIKNYGYHQQAQWYCDGVAAVTGETPERFCFVVVSKKPPHSVSVCWLDDEAMQWGAILNRRAKGVFAWCRRHNRWPGYQPDLTSAPSAFTVGLPSWAIRDLEERHKVGEFEPPATLEEVA